MINPEAKTITVDVFSEEYYKLKAEGIIDITPELENALSQLSELSQMIITIKA